MDNKYGKIYKCVGPLALQPHRKGLNENTLMVSLRLKEGGKYESNYRNRW